MRVNKVYKEGKSIEVEYSNNGLTESVSLGIEVETECDNQNGGGGSGDTAQEDGLITRTLTEYTNDRVTAIGNYAFAQNTVIEKVSFQNVVEFTGSNNFNGCTNLKEVYFPKLANVFGGNSFRSCTSLPEIVLPSLLSNPPSLQGCTALKKVDMTIARRNPTTAPVISASTFNGAKILDTVIIRTGELVVLNNINAFTGTPLASDGTGGTVYVPRALISSYQTATNWSTLYEAGTCNFVAIEGSEYE